MNENRSTLSQICKLLGVSRPKLNKLRETHDLQTTQSGRKLLFFKNEVIKKILCNEPIHHRIDLSLNTNDSIESLLIDAHTYDFRKIRSIDSYGAIALLTSVRRQLMSDHDINIVTNNEFPCRYLETIGFFKELKRLNANVFWNHDSLVPLSTTDLDGITLQPIQFVGYRGAERTRTESLMNALINNGYGTELSSYTAWVLGELADNSHTHAQGPCYFVSCEATRDRKYISIAIGDMGMGIPASLKKNLQYAKLKDEELLLLSFKTGVSSFSDEFKRGKGLSDVLRNSMELKSYFRVCSGKKSFFADFQDYTRKIVSARPTIKHEGTLFGFVLFDNDTLEMQKEECDDLIDKTLEKLK